MQSGEIDYDVIVDIPDLMVSGGIIGYWPGAQSGERLPVYATASQLAKMRAHEEGHKSDFSGAYNGIIAPMLNKAKGRQGESNALKVDNDPKCDKCLAQLDNEIGFDNAVQQYWQRFDQLNTERDNRQNVSIQTVNGKPVLTLSW